MALGLEVKSLLLSDKGALWEAHSLEGGPQAVTVTSHCGRYEANQLWKVPQIGPSGGQCGTGDSSPAQSVQL